jgi:cyclin-dependent kinase 10
MKAPLKPDDESDANNEDASVSSSRSDATESAAPPNKGKKRKLVALPFGSCVNVSERYEKLARIGHGSYGIVYKARDRQVSARGEEYVAIKRCIPHHESSDGFPVTALREIHTLRLLCSGPGHPNIVKFHNVAVSRSAVFLVFEYCTHDLGQVLDYYYNEYQCSPFFLSSDKQDRFRFFRGSGKGNQNRIHRGAAIVKTLMYQLLSAVDFMHARHILHRDLKMSNLLYHKGQLKVADFGLSRLFSASTAPRSSIMSADSTKMPSSQFAPQSVQLTPQVASLWYRAPEILFYNAHISHKAEATRKSKGPNVENSSDLYEQESKGQTTSTKLGGPSPLGYSFTMDTYAVGCIMGEFLTGTPLIGGQNEMDQIQKMIETFGTPPQVRESVVGDIPGSRSNSWLSDFTQYSFILDGTITLPGSAPKHRDSAIGKMSTQVELLLKRFGDGTSNSDRSTNYQKDGDQSQLGFAGIQLLSSLLRYEPRKRWTAAQALSSAYFTELPQMLPVCDMPEFPPLKKHAHVDSGDSNNGPVALPPRRPATGDDETIPRRPLEKDHPFAS